MAFCSNCGAQIPDGSKFCGVCGAAQAAPEQQAPAAAPEQPVYQAPAAPEQPVYQAPAAPEQPIYQAPQYQQNYQAPQYQAPQYQYQQQNWQQAAPAAAAAFVSPFSLKGLYDKAINVLKDKPIRLWGLSMMCTLLTTLASLFGVVPIIVLPLTYALQMGMTAIYLDGIRKKEVNSDQLFRGFSKNNFLRYAAGMGWKDLWVLIWTLIPVVGPIFGIIKSYTYRFAPYIMLEDDEISATAALRKSIEMTKGLRGKMFKADIVIVLILLAATLVLSLLALIPYVGVLFTIINVLLVILEIIFLPLLMGLISAAFYDTKVSEDQE